MITSSTLHTVDLLLSYRMNVFLRAENISAGFDFSETVTFQGKFIFSWSDDMMIN